MPIAVQASVKSAPSPAPTASMGIKIPHGTPAPTFNTVAAIFKATTMRRVAQSGEEKMRSTPEAPLPSSLMNPCPPPIAYTVISPNAPAARKGTSILPTPLKNVIF